MTTFIKSALYYKSLGISTISTDANKRSISRWRPYQEHIGSEEELQEMFLGMKVEGLAVVCGNVSGHLEVIDIDTKYDLTGSLFEDFIQSVIDADPELVKSLVVAKTRSGGYHLYYRCSDITGNIKLARRYSTEEEIKKDPHDKVKVLIETRGEGGYVIASPSPGYKFVQNKPTDIPTITPEQRTIIMECARAFNQVVEEISHHRHYVERKSYNKSPFADYNERGDIIGLLQRHGWSVVGQKGAKTIFKRPGQSTSQSSGDFHSGLGFFSVFTTSSVFEPMKGYRPAAVYAILECNSDFEEAARRLVADGYGEPYKRVARDVKKFIRKNLSEGVTGEILHAKIASAFNLSMEDAKQTVVNVEREEQATLDEFWQWDTDREKLNIIYTRYVRFLEDNGFGLYFYDNGSSIFKVVHNDRNRLEEATSERIKKFTQDYILTYDLQGVDFTQEQLLEIIYRNGNLFSDTLFEFLSPTQIDFLRDTAKTCYFPFKNGVVEITATGIDIRPYGQVNKVIWKSDIIPFHVDPAMSEDNRCEYADFIYKICNEDVNRMISACTIIGYLLHKYKNPALAYAIILGEETEDESKGGGTGKGLFVKGLEKMLNVETIDGKNFKPDKSFAYQRVKLETKLVVIQDAEKTFEFQKFYSIITEGLTIEKKNKDELYISYADSPKVLVTTNYTINDEGNHAKRRQKVIEFSNYFGPNRTPLDEFGHLLFDDWDNDEWNRFYNFMFYCVHVYLQRGIVEIEQGNNYRKKKIKTQFTPEFLDWFEGYAGGGYEQWQQFGILYSDFLSVNEFDRKDYSQKRFKKALQVSAENFGFDLENKKNSQNNGKIEMRMRKCT